MKWLLAILRWPFTEAKHKEETEEEFNSRQQF